MTYEGKVYYIYNNIHINTVDSYQMTPPPPVRATSGPIPNHSDGYAPPHQANYNTGYAPSRDHAPPPHHNASGYRPPENSYSGPPPSSDSHRHSQQHQHQHQGAPPPPSLNNYSSPSAPIDRRPLYNNYQQIENSKNDNMVSHN